MGEAAEMMLDGTLCATCGEYLGLDEGFPIVCSVCEGDGAGYQAGDLVMVLPGPAPKIPCPHCGRRVRGEQGLHSHITAVHGELLGLIAYDRLPKSLREGMRRYVEHGVEPGGFLNDVLRNSLYAVISADRGNAEYLPKIYRWCIDQLPAPCWGSHDAVARWKKAGGELGSKESAGGE